MKMPNIKTAISLERPLFEEIEALAREMSVSRSRLFSLAAQDFLREHKSRKLLEAINKAYIVPDIVEEDLKTKMKLKHRRLVKDQW